MFPGAFGRRPIRIFMARDQIDMTPLQSRDELVAWLEAGVKPPSNSVMAPSTKTPFTLEGPPRSLRRARVSAR
jgi:hypothetical protein